MIVSKLIRNTILCAIAFMAMPVLASAQHKSANNQGQKKTIVLGNQATVDGIALTPGNYEILINGKKVAFERDGKTVVTAPCDWKTLQDKSPYDAVVVSSDNTVQEIDFEGSDQALEVM